MKSHVSLTPGSESDSGDDGVDVESEVSTVKGKRAMWTLCVQRKVEDLENFVKVRNRSRRSKTRQEMEVVIKGPYSVFFWSLSSGTIREVL